MEGWLKRDGIMGAIFRQLGLSEHGVYMGIPQVHRFSIIFPCFEWPLWGYTATLFSQLGSVSHEVAVCKTHTIPGNMLDG